MEVTLSADKPILKIDQEKLIAKTTAILKNEKIPESAQATEFLNILPISMRAYNALWDSKLVKLSIREIVLLNDKELLSIEKFGRKSLDEVRPWLDCVKTNIDFGTNQTYLESHQKEIVENRLNFARGLLRSAGLKDPEGIVLRELLHQLSEKDKDPVLVPEGKYIISGTGASYSITIQKTKPQP